MFYKFRTQIFTAVIAILMMTNAWAESEYSYTIITDQSAVNNNGTNVTIDGGLILATPGVPQLGYKTVKLVLPSDKIVTGYSIELSEPVSIGATSIDYVVGDLKTGNYPADTAFMPDETIYGSNEIYPAKRIEILNKGNWGDIHLVNLAAYPIGYRPLSGEIILYPKITVHFELQAKPFEFGLNPKSDIVAYKSVQKSASNKPEIPTIIGLPPAGDPPIIPTSIPMAEYLIITSGAIAPGFYPFLEWKNQKGVPTDLVLIEDILATVSGVDPAEQLRNYLIQAYNDGIRWVLLGGDEDVVPIRYLYPGNVNGYEPGLNYQQISDMYYSDLSGDWDVDGDGVWGESYQDNPDIFPELYVGRVPARNMSQAQIWGNKAILYEKYPGNGDPSYLTKALFITADQMRDYGQHYVLAELIPNSFTVDVNRLEEMPSGGSPLPTGPYGYEVINIMNEGWGFISNLNHGSPEWYASKSQGYNNYGWSGVWSTIVPNWGACGGLIQLTTNNQPAIHYSISCDLGALDFDKGILSPNPYATTVTYAEAYLFEPGGGVAFLGNTRWGWVSSSYNLERKFLTHIFNDSTSRISEAEALSKIDYPSYRDIGYGHTLFGDPEMCMWTSVDGYLTMDGPTEFELGEPQVLEYTVQNDGNPVQGVKVCMYLPGDIYGTAFTDENGIVNFGITPLFDGVMTVTATKPNFIPAQLEVVLGTPAGIDDEITLPTSPEVFQNYPNPFNNSTIIEFDLPNQAQVDIDIYDIGGRLVTKLASEIYEPGRNRVAWNGLNQDHGQTASGIYFFKFTCGNLVSIKQMTLLK